MSDQTKDKIVNLAFDLAGTIIAMVAAGIVVCLFLPVLKKYPVSVSVAIGYIIGVILAKPIEYSIKKMKKQ